MNLVAEELCAARVRPGGLWHLTRGPGPGADLLCGFDVHNQYWELWTGKGEPWPRHGFLCIGCRYRAEQRATKCGAT